MKQFLIAIALTMSVTIGVSAQVPIARVPATPRRNSMGFIRRSFATTTKTRHLQSRVSSVVFNVDASMAATGRILGLK